MRIFGFEITKVPKQKADDLWCRPPVSTFGRRIWTMTPDELRTELRWCYAEMLKGNHLMISPKDTFQRVLSLPIHLFKKET